MFDFYKFAYYLAKISCFLGNHDWMTGKIFDWCLNCKKERVTRS